MAASPSISSMGGEYVLPSSNSSKPYQYLVETIGLDHNYCKPWCEREKIPHARPAKRLFSPQSENDSEPSKNAEEKKPSKEDEIIDVDTVEEAPLHGPGAINMQYDVMKSKIVMSECQKYVSSVSSKRTPDTWEELICRTGWTTQQNVLFDKILKIVSAYRLAWLTYQGSANEPILRRVAVDKATKRVRQILSRIEWDTKLTTWLHSSMVDGLSISLLACYLDIVQTLRSKVPTLVDKMIAGGTTHRRVSTGPSDNLTALLKRPWEATVALTSFQRPRKITGTPLLLIVPSGPTTTATGNSTKRSRFWHHHLSHFGKVIPVTMHLSNSGRGVSIGQCLDHMIGAVQAKVLELKNHFPNRPVVLIGWATGALVSLQVALKESVCAVVCLGFPLLGVDGMRGGTGDPFLDSKTPTMFVIGSLSTSCSFPDIEEFRTKLLADTSLLVVGGADDQLRLTSAKKKKEGVTQSVVDRRIMDDIGEFLNQAVHNLNDDSHPRLDYFDFDDGDTRRKKPKTEYRKRAAGDTAGSAKAPKKPRGRTPKANNGEGNATKKPKAVKKPPTSKPTVLVPVSGQTVQASGAPAVRPTGSLPIAPLRGTHPTIPGGIPLGVPLTSVPISAVAVPLTGVPVSRVSIPGVRLSGVNIPVSGVNVPVSAVIKQGSLGGRSFVFPGATGGSSNSGVTTSGITTVGNSGNTHHLKIVVNPSADGGIKLTGLPKSGGSTESQATMQYKTTAITTPLSTKSSVPLKVTTAAPTSQITTVSTTTQSSLVTSLSTTSVVLTSSSVTSLSVASSSVTSSSSTSSTPLTKTVSTVSSKPTVVSRTVVTVPKSAVVSGQAQLVMHQGQLSLIGKSASIQTSSPNTPTTQQKVASQGTRVTTPTANKSQISLPSGSAKQTAVRVTHAGSTQSATNIVKASPSPQPMTRTIQVGVKRTVTYNPSSSTKTVTVVSRSLPSATLTTHVSNMGHYNLDRLKQKLRTMQMQNSQALTNTLAGTSTQNIKTTNITLSSTQSAALASAKALTQTATQPSSSSSTSTSVQANSKPSAQIVTLPSTQTSAKCNTKTVVLTSAPTTPKSSAQIVQPSTQTSALNTSSTSTVTTPATAQPSSKPSTTAVQAVAPAQTVAPMAEKPKESTKHSEQIEQSDSGLEHGSKSDEEKLAEKINTIVKEVVGGKQRTTRQSVRRLVAAAKLAEEQHKRKDGGEGSKD